MSGLSWPFSGLPLPIELYFGACLVLIVVVVWVLVSAVAGRERTSTDDAAQILKARFARGEITQAEYEQARRLLGI